MAEGSDRSRLVALVLCGVLGFFGAHRFYSGKVGTGILQLLTFGGLGVWWLYDLVLISSGGFRDVDGRRIIFWTEDESLHRPMGPGDRGELTAEILDEIDGLRAEVMELTERVDFTERLLTKQRKSDEFS